MSGVLNQRACVVGGGPTGIAMAKLLVEKNVPVDLVEGHNLGGQLAVGYDWQRLNTPCAYFSLPGISFDGLGYIHVRRAAETLASAVVSDERITLVRASAVRVTSGTSELYVCFRNGARRTYRNVILAIGRPEMRRGFRLAPGQVALDPYRDARFIAESETRCVVVGSGATAVDCAVELVSQGKRVDLVVRHPLHWFPRVRPSLLGGALVKHAGWSLLAPVIGCGSALIKRANAPWIPSRFGPFFDLSCRGGPIIINDRLGRVLSSGMIDLFWSEGYELPGSVPVFNCTGYRSGGDAVEVLFSSYSGLVIRLGRGFSRGWLPHCGAACTAAYDLIERATSVGIPPSGSEEFDFSLPS